MTRHSKRVRNERVACPASWTHCKSNAVQSYSLCEWVRDKNLYECRNALC